MPEEQYELMIDGLDKAIKMSILKFANDYGLKLSCSSLQQGSLFYPNNRSRLIELLSLGMDVWPDAAIETPDDSGEPQYETPRPVVLKLYNHTRRL